MKVKQPYLRRWIGGRGGRNVRLHRLIWEEAYGPIPDGMWIDHINGDKHDNRLDNLRLATGQQNQMNRPRAVGVSRSRGRWQAQITVDYRNIHLGNFTDYLDALGERRKAETLYFGAFAPQRK